MRRAQYTRLVNGSVAVALPIKGGFCTVCKVNRDWTVEFYDGCPAVSLTDFIWILVRAAELALKR